MTVVRTRRAHVIISVVDVFVLPTLPALLLFRCELMLVVLLLVTLFVWLLLCTTLLTRTPSRAGGRTLSALCAATAGLFAATTSYASRRTGTAGPAGAPCRRTSAATLSATLSQTESSPSAVAVNS